MAAKCSFEVAWHWPQVDTERLSVTFQCDDLHTTNGGFEGDAADAAYQQRTVGNAQDGWITWRAASTEALPQQPVGEAVDAFCAVFPYTCQQMYLDSFALTQDMEQAAAQNWTLQLPDWRNTLTSVSITDTHVVLASPRRRDAGNFHVFGEVDGTLLYCPRVSPFAAFHVACEVYDLAQREKHDVSVEVTCTDDHAPVSRFNLSHTLIGTGVRDALLSAVAHSLYMATTEHQQLELVVQKHKDRDRESDIGIAFTFFFLSLGMALWIVLMGFWQSWLKPVLPRRRVLVWSLVFLVIFQVFLWGVGLLGWFLFALLGGLYMMGVCIAYLCTARRRQRGTLPASASTGEAGQVEMATWRGEKDSSIAPSADGYSGYSLAPSYPDALNRTQKRLVLGLMAATAVTFVSMIIAAFSWEVDDYYVYDRVQRVAVVEYQPDLISKTVAALYTHPKMAKTLKVDFLNTLQTQYCGSKYDSDLDSDADKESAIKVAFIDKYDIDMGMYARTHYTQYRSVNDWFMRELAMNPDNTTYVDRPIAAPGSDSVAVFPADARVMFFPAIHLSKEVWIKSHQFTVAKLLAEDNLAKMFENGSMAIIRLAPQDYHRFHSPITGHISYTGRVNGTLYSVNADAIQSGNGAILNTRIVHVIHSLSFGSVAFIAIGATCVGSVKMVFEEGNNVRKGAEFGHFEFGGSTVVLLFEPGKIVLEEDIVHRSLMGVETLVRMGTQMGVASSVDYKTNGGDASTVQRILTEHLALWPHWSPPPLSLAPSMSPTAVPVQVVSNSTV